MFKTLPTDRQAQNANHERQSQQRQGIVALQKQELSVVEIKTSAERAVAKVEVLDFWGKGFFLKGCHARTTFEYGAGGGTFVASLANKNHSQSWA
ncbi:MAG: hypothetical protein ACKVUS_19320 [Saprospiraceae bacterium]